MNKIWNTDIWGANVWNWNIWADVKVASAFFKATLTVGPAIDGTISSGAKFSTSSDPTVGAAISASDIKVDKT